MTRVTGAGFLQVARSGKKAIPRISTPHGSFGDLVLYRVEPSADLVMDRLPVRPGDFDDQSLDSCQGDGQCVLLVHTLPSTPTSLNGWVWRHGLAGSPGCLESPAGDRAELVALFVSPDWFQLRTSGPNPQPEER